MVFNKPLEELKEADLEGLIGLPESQKLEFKREPFAKGDAGTKEMLRDLVSFANASGGYVVIGVETDEEDRGTRLKGIENGEEEVRRLTDSYLANISERVLGLTTKAIPLSNGGNVIVIFVPRSTTAPHMITFQGINQFWKRYGTIKNRMSVEEIKEAVQKTVDLRKNLEGFLEERKIKILRSIGTRPYFVISASPLIIKDELLNIFDPQIRELINEPPYSRPSGWNIGRTRLEIRPSLYGLIAFERLGKGLELEIFRNAYIELRVPIDVDGFCRKTLQHEGVERPILYAYPLSEFPVSFLHFAEKLFSQNSVLEPIIIQLSLYNVNGFGLAQDIDFDEIFGPNFWNESHLELPAMQFPMPFQPEQIAQILSDRVWNAFGFDKAPLFVNGGFKPKP